MQQWTISQLDCDRQYKVDFIQQAAMINSVVGLRTPKHFPKPNLHQKVTDIVWWSAAHLIHCSFLNSSKIITSEKHAQQISEMHQKLQYLQPALVNRKSPGLLHDNVWLHVAQPVLQSLDEFGLKFCLIHHIHLTSHQLITTFSSILTPFLWGKWFHSQQAQKILSKKFVESWSADFYGIRINKLIPHWQKCIDCNGSYFD